MFAISCQLHIALRKNLTEVFDPRLPTTVHPRGLWAQDSALSTQRFSFLQGQVSGAPLPSRAGAGDGGFSVDAEVSHVRGCQGSQKDRPQGNRRVFRLKGTRVGSLLVGRKRPICTL